ncbi:MAG: DNA primase, partial [Candidatus Omnitrophica bacterium]|nr:DNA primase [Candidatus Omnitrophota bacterium]MBD3269834.1 DNA primase [Candidatus Omnitrophota bacterium]
MIPQDFIDDLQSRCDIVEVIGSYIPLKRAGRNFKAVCPFHNEKTPSFIVSPQKQIFHCFGCQEGGGVFQFLMLIEKVNFPEAVEMLAKRMGIEVPYRRNKPGKSRDAFYKALDEAAGFYNRNLINNSDFKTVREYLKKRGIGEKTIKKFRLGFAPSGNALINHMRKKGFVLEMLEKCGLITYKNESFRDVFRDRIVFPIYDVRCRVVGFGARLWKEVSGSPKYINSLENEFYSKRHHLFGLNFSKEGVSKSGRAIVVEGYLDMITPFMRGVPNIAASLGTALTIEQIKLLKRYASGIILLFDSDKAGQMAALRSVDLGLENNLRVEVASLPESFDPDSLIRKKGREAFEELINSRKDFFDYKLAVLKGNYDVESIEGKSSIAKEMLASINKLESEVEKHEYIKKLSHEIRVKEDILIAEFRKNFLKESISYYNRRDNRFLSKENKAFKEYIDFLPITEKVLIKFMITKRKAFEAVSKRLDSDD